MNEIFEMKAEIFGRVQRIGFRMMIKNYADKNQLKGYATNKEDGAVEAVIQGNKEKTDKFLEWIKNNPGLSKVTNIKIQVCKPKKIFDSFEIKKEYGFWEDKSRSFIKLGKSIFE